MILKRLSVAKLARVCKACPFIRRALLALSGKRIVCFFILTNSLFPAKAQTYFFDNYSVEDNPANSKVYSILQDKNHLVWLGTPSGVSVFDGITFNNYTAKDGLAEKGVWTIYQDSHGYIWFGHLDGGISRYDGKKLEYIPINIMESKSITSICENNKGQLWITSEGSGAIRIDNPNASIENFKYEHYKGKRLSDRVFGCYLFSDKKNYFITDAGIKVFNPKENNFDNFNIDGMPRFFQITTILEDNDRNLWFGTFHGGLYKYIRRENTFKVYDIRDGLSSNWITAITQDNNENIWVGTWGGVTKIDHGTLQVFDSKNGLHADNVYCITPDAEGNMLIGTAEHGLSIYKGEFLLFNSREIFTSPQVWSILQDSKHQIWFGTNDGITIYDPALTQHQFRIYDGNNLGIPSKVRFLKEDNNQNIWVGTEDNSIYSYSQKNKKFRLCQPANNMRLTAMEIDRKGYLWLGALDRLMRYNTQTDDLSSFSQGDGLIGNEISAIYIDVKNTKYIGSRGKGITIFKDSLTINSTKDTLLGNTTPNCITGDNVGNIWIGTDGQGLICYQNGIIKKKFREADGLLSDIINLVVISSPDEIYAGTNRGLNKINLKANTIETYTKRNGFVGIQANPNAGIQDSEGRLLFGTINGAILYNPRKDNSLIAQSLTQIRRVRVNLEERPFHDHMKLSYTENAIIIDYASICLTNPEAVLYQYMLEGLNNDWQPVTKETSAKYSPLQPNTYTFKVRARNSSGIWNTEPATFTFRIGPPFYQTWWFITLSAFSGLLMLIVYIKLRERALIREKLVLEEKVRERTAEVVKVNNELAMKNKDITDSILYASRIQNALLPPELPIENTFVLFKPRDIVSGDFFWFMSDGDKHWIAAVDCTGHGVPGAFMSIIGFNSLNNIIKELGITRPSEILDKLDAEVSNTLHQYHTDDQVHDGMDIALVCYDSKSKSLEYSGAFNPLWIVRKGELLETRANRFAIGLAPGLEKGFINHTISIETGDVLYLFSDGYADQFGGPNGKKLKVGSFKDLIIEVHQHPMNEQKKMLEDYFQKWRGINAQVDDVLVIGWKFEF